MTQRFVMPKGLQAWISITLAASAVLVVIFQQGCGGGSGSMENVSSSTLITLSITPANQSIAPATTTQLTALGTFSNGSMRNVTKSATWNSSNTSIASVGNAAGSQGLATALASIGTTTITAVVSGIIGTTTLSTSHVASMSVEPVSPASIAPGTMEQFIATGTLTSGVTQDLTSFATWTSLNPPSGTVSDTTGSKGLATAGSTPGSATIQATYDGATGSATLTASHVTSIAVAPQAVNVPQGLTQQFSATGTLVDSTSQDLTVWSVWSSSSPTIAAISTASGSKGLASALAVGSTNITAFYDSITSSPAATLTVTQPVLQSISITPVAQSIALGLTQQYAAIGSYSDGSAPDITSLATWHSSDTGVATVSNATGSRGLAASVAQGNTVIAASLSGVTSNSATLSITPPVLASILVSPATATISLATGITTQQFTATGIFTDASIKNLTTTVTWSSSKTTVATISNMSGLQGLATITLGSTLPDSTNITATLSGITSKASVLTVTF